MYSLQGSEMTMYIFCCLFLYRWDCNLKKDHKDIVQLMWLCLLLWLTDWLIIDWFVEVPQIKLRSLSVLDKCSTTKLHSNLSIKYINTMVIIITAENRPLVFACGRHIYIVVSKLNNLYLMVHQPSRNQLWNLRLDFWVVLRFTKSCA